MQRKPGGPVVGIWLLLLSKFGHVGIGRVGEQAFHHLPRLGSRVRIPSPAPVFKHISGIRSERVAMMSLVVFARRHILALSPARGTVSSRRQNARRAAGRPRAKGRCL